MQGIKEELQKAMAERYDIEFTQMSDLIARAYEAGLEDGAMKAKAQIINLISGGKHENKGDI